jgi:CRISPR/Cas system-associated exonuclease Cas4 (RecB family)
MIPAEVREVPPKISEFLCNGNEPYKRKANHYWVSDICKCLRQSYYEFIGIPQDDLAARSVDDLWSLRSRKFLHNLTYAYRWRELDIEKEFCLLNDAETVFLQGRLDMYDYKTSTIIDLKTSNAIKWQHQHGLIPKLHDIDQIQCYGSLYKGIIGVSDLILMYADMKNLLAFKVHAIDRTNWIKARLARLHTAVRSKTLPPAERSKSCDFCPYKQRCSNIDGPA